MQAAIVILSVYAILITAKYILKCGEIIEYDNDCIDCQNSRTELLERLGSVRAQLHIAELENKANTETLSRIRQAFEPASFDAKEDVPHETI